MTGHPHQYRYTEGPAVANMAWSIVTTSIPALPIWALARTAGGDPGLWILAALTVPIPLVFAIPVIRRFHALRDGKAILIVDHDGLAFYDIGLANIRRRYIRFAWTDLDRFEFEQVKGRADLLIRWNRGPGMAGRGTGSLSLNGLDAPPAAIFDTMKTLSGRSC